MVHFERARWDRTLVRTNATMFLQHESVEGRIEHWLDTLISLWKYKAPGPNPGGHWGAIFSVYHDSLIMAWLLHSCYLTRGLNTSLSQKLLWKFLTCSAGWRRSARGPNFQCLCALSTLLLDLCRAGPLHQCTAVIVTISVLQAALG